MSLWLVPEMEAGFGLSAGALRMPRHNNALLDCDFV